MTQVKLKVCGMREPDNIHQVIQEVHPDYMGFIFYEKSPRNADQVDQILLNELQGVQKTGVFVNASIDFVTEKVEKYGLDLIQLHGEESHEYCKELKDKGYIISKAIGVRNELNHELLKSYQGVIDFFLFDTKGENRGGNGITFDWSVLKEYLLNIPFFLAGGIDVDSLADLEILKDLPLYAIDVNSKFEIEPGNKDVERLKILKSDLLRYTKD
ncbi:MAG: phosphoribosylanthranilate isomerase [Cyclobacteriaceae bacterium]